MTKMSIWRRAQDVIAQGALTNSKHPDSHIFGVYPTHISRGQGPYLFDHDNNRYLDYITGLGANLFGYGNSKIVSSLYPLLNDGFSHSLPTHHELESGEALKVLFPFVDKWKFLSTGTEACNAAIKIARTAQGVKNGGEGLHEMLTEEICRRFSHKMLKDWEACQSLQDLHQEISEPTKDNGNKTQSSKEICEDGKGDISGKEILAASLQASSGEWPGAHLLPSEEGPKKWSNLKDAVRGLWGEDSSCSPQRLHQTIARQLALSIASRRETPKYLVLSDGYHGHGDSYVSLTEPHCGSLKDLSILPLKGNEDLVEIAAAVIVEPVITDHSDERKKWLRELKDKCRANGTVLIFDEVITGFRFKNWSVSRDFNITPDLIIIGKAMASGLRLSAVGGKPVIMDGDYFVSSTYAGEILAHRACRTVCDLLQSDHNYKIEKLWESGEEFQKKFNEMASGYIKIVGYPTRGVFEGETLTKALFFQEACKAHILLCNSFFYNFPLVSENFYFFTFLKDFISRMKLGDIKLEGNLPRSPFAERVRNAGNPKKD